ncbi:hypothetical protein IQ07DRAFT_320657 [Pyrenochaeta sp. DS3sAY3a]|nr:hypothetical protein IQ07DRAFT_320657 [Pyrenochaeta sp. DS3sAY3a]
MHKKQARSATHERWVGKPPLRTHFLCHHELESSENIGCSDLKDSTACTSPRTMYQASINRSLAFFRNDPRLSALFVCLKFVVEALERIKLEEKLYIRFRVVSRYFV